MKKDKVGAFKDQGLAENTAMINEYLDSVVDTVRRLNRDSLSRFVELLIETYERDGTIYVFGNGGSGANASHFAGDFLKGVSYGLAKRFKVICLNDNSPALLAIANDISYDDIFVEQLKNFCVAGDLVIGISGSGNSENVVRALEYGASVGARTVAMCGYSGGRIKEIADLAVHAEIDNMEVSEDLHMIIVHCVKRVLMKKFDKAGKYVGQTAC